ncbi:porin [Candidatus Pelagibacter sp.]|nr:porin [Candidatus Pelagibacter sp.]
MNNIKKIGLTALAGSLVATSAFAGAMSVSGSAKVTYASNGEEGVAGGTAFTNSKGITFSGSGELDNGFNVSTNYTMTDAAFSSSAVVLDMGDSGTLSFMNSTAKAGIDKYADVMPTAGEEVWDDIMDGSDNGVVGVTAANAFGYEVSTMGVTLSASYAKEALGTANSLVIISDDLMDGLQVGAGVGKAVVSATSEDDHSTVWAKYTAGMATVGIQSSAIDKASADQDRLAMAISLAVNENLSVSYGMSTVDFETASLTDEESSGISASYTMGGMTIAGVFNSMDSVDGASGTDRTRKEISVAFAF